MLRFARENRGKVKLFGDKPSREQSSRFSPAKRSSASSA
jgi:hypothetical protein